MPEKLTRKKQLVFGSTAAVGQIRQFGSLAAGAPVSTTDPDTVQALANYLQGWHGAITAGASPAIEDMNAILYVLSYNTAYQQQTGIAEWSATTEYFIGSIVNNGAGVLYASITDNNLNQALTSTANWRRLGGNPIALNPATQSPYALVINEGIYGVNTANGAQTITIPAAAFGFTFTVKDTAGMASTNPISFSRSESNLLENYAGSYIAEADYGTWTWYCDGINWWLK